MCPDKANSAKRPKRRRVVGALVEPLEPVGDSRALPDLDDNRSDRARMEFSEEFSIPRTALDREPTTWEDRGDSGDR
jgi:hypothetical protein